MRIPPPSNTGRLTSIPSTAICFFPDGNVWCCVFGDFINLQESPAGFGATFEDAMAELKAQVEIHPQVNGTPAEETP